MTSDAQHGGDRPSDPPFDITSPAEAVGGSAAGAADPPATTVERRNEPRSWPSEPDVGHEAVAAASMGDGATGDSGRPIAGRTWLKRIVSVWLLYHVLAVIVAPASVSPSSELMQTCWRGFRHYLQLFYLNHGYHFFAPEPSYSTLVGYTLEFADGRTESGRFPNRSIYPRLMYHRHFMLTEFLGFVPDEEEQPWHRSYARHLGRATGAERVSLSRITHYLPTREAVLSGATLNEAESFSEAPLGSYRCDEL